MANQASSLMEINSPRVSSEPRTGDRESESTSSFSDSKNRLTGSANESQDPTDNVISFDETEQNLTTHDEDSKLIEYDKKRKSFLIALGSSAFLGLGSLILISISSAYWQKNDEKSDMGAERSTAHVMHITFMTLSIPIFASYGVLTYRVLPERPMWLIKWIHGSFFIFVTVFFIFGFLKSFSSLEPLLTGDFSTIHSWLGIGILLLLCVEIGTGFVFLCSDKENLKLDSRFQKMHRRGGKFLIVLSSATVITGLDSMKCILTSPNSANTIGVDIFMNILTALMIVFYLVIFLMMFSQRFQRKARPNWTCIYNNPSNTQETSAESSKTVIQKSLILNNKETT